MKYQVNQKVTIKSEDWYNENKAQNGFIVFKNGNKICTFSPGMVKFCGKTFTVAKVVTGSSIYPDHYTFVEDGGSYKWSDDMISGVAGEVTEAPEPAKAPEVPQTPAPEPVKEQPAPETAKQPEPAKEPEKKSEPKPKPQKSAQQPKTTPVKKEETEDQWGDLGSQQPAPEAPAPVKEPDRPIQQPEPEKAPEVPQTPAPEPVRPAQDPAPQQPQPENEEVNAFETYTILLTPREGAKLQDCAVQAYRILAGNEVFPSVRFDFNGFEFDIKRKTQEAI